ncbi:TPA: phospholipase D family protein, partial [Escherichia coli]
MYTYFQHSERGHRLRSPMVVSPPYGITTRLDWPRLNSGVFMSGKKTIVTLLRVSLLACPLLFTTPSFAMIDTPSVKVGFSPEGSAS